MRVMPAMAQFNATVPFPGTPLYDLAVKNHWLDDHLKYTDLQHHLSLMRTDALTREDIVAARKRMYRTLYFNPRWLRSQFQNREEMGFVIRYYLKCLSMFWVHGMRHSH